MTTERKSMRTVVGTVVSDKMQKTITVREERLVKHPLYGKYVRRATRYKAHDEANDANEGDLVEIVSTRPLSKTKSYRLLRVVRRFGGGMLPSAAVEESTLDEGADATPVAERGPAAKPAAAPEASQASDEPPSVSPPSPGTTEEGTAS